MDRTQSSYSPEIRESIRRRATEIYNRSGKLAGRDTRNWCQAEAEILTELSQRPAHAAVVVKVEGVLYTGEYEPALADGYKAGEWEPGQPVPVRFEGDRLYLHRPNGRYLETTVVKKSR